MRIYVYAGWNMRDKKTANEKMTFIKKEDFPFEGDRKKNFVEIYKQGTYKYLVYVEGHCAACRYVSFIIFIFIFFTIFFLAGSVFSCGKQFLEPICCNSVSIFLGLYKG
jgi:hypothetical protein